MSIEHVVEVGGQCEQSESRKVCSEVVVFAKPASSVFACESPKWKERLKLSGVHTCTRVDDALSIQIED